MPERNGTFKPGEVAEVIALATPGEEVPSHFKPFKQIRYTLEDGRTWYAPLTAGVKLNNLELAIGEPFRVCKRTLGANGSVIDVLRVNKTPSGRGVQTPTAPVGVEKANGHSNGSVLEGKLRASLAAVSRSAAPVVAAMNCINHDGPEPAADDPGHVNCNGHKTAPPALMTGHAQFFLERAIELINVFAAAFRYSTTTYNGTLSKDDVRALVTTAYIQHAKGAR